MTLAQIRGDELDRVALLEAVPDVRAGPVGAEHLAALGVEEDDALLMHGSRHVRAWLRIVL
jgi:hypothetical protein